MESKVEEQAEAAWSEALKNQLAAKKHRQLLGSSGRLMVEVVPIVPPGCLTCLTLGLF